MSYLAIVRKTKEELQQKQAALDITEGPIIAVLIDSPIVGPLWFALDDGFKPGDAIPVFFASELPFLREMSAAALRRRYEEKCIGGWIRERNGAPTKH